MVVLYSTLDCPRCQELKRKLNEANIAYVNECNIERMTEIGITSVPILEVNGVKMKLKTANEWIDSVLDKGECQ